MLWLVATSVLAAEEPYAGCSRLADSLDARKPVAREAEIERRLRNGAPLIVRRQAIWRWKSVV